MTTAPLLHLGDKDLEEIQQIVTSTKAANMAKWVTSQTADLAIMTRKRSDGRQQTPNPKANEECFNCGKKGHYVRDCYSNSKRKPKDKKAAEKAKRVCWKRNQATEKVTTTRSANQDNNFDFKSYPAGQVFMTRLSSKETTDCWYLDSCASRHIYNNRELFSDIRSKNYKFVTVSGDIIQSKKLGTVHLPLQSGKTTMTLLNIAYAPKYDFNLISLGQFRNSRISYHDHPNSMVLK